MDACSAEEVRECVVGHLRYVPEAPLNISVRVFFVPDDVLYMRTTAVNWNIAGLCGSFAELFFFHLKEDGKQKPLPPPERPSVGYDYRQLFGFDSDALWSYFTLMCKTFFVESLGDWT